MSADNYIYFAKYYDSLMSDVPYSKIAARINDIIGRHCKNAELIADIACGTGSLCTELSRRGFKTVGGDICCEMLSVAESKKACLGLDIRYTELDMTDFRLFEKADVITATLDSINHLAGLDEIKSAFLCVYNNLSDGGLFIFDMNTPYKHRCVLSNNAFIFEEDGVFCAWQNEYNEEDNRVDIFLDFFEKQKDGSYKRFCEEFSEAAFDDYVIKGAAKSCGLEFVESFDGYSSKRPSKVSERILYVFKKPEE